jgi:hypothetical protein
MTEAGKEIVELVKKKGKFIWLESEKMYFILFPILSLAV